MKDKTHLNFSLGFLNLYVLIFIKESFLAWFCFGLSFPISAISLVPNLLDVYAGANFQFNGVQLKKHRFALQYRHPLTHSPWTLGYFLPFIYLLSVLSNIFLSAIYSLLAIGWFSHIFLDAMNPEGVPLGRKSVFSNHLVKHYQWRQISNARTFSFAKIAFNSHQANNTISRLGLFLFSMNLANLILNHSDVVGLLWT